DPGPAWVSDRRLAPVLLRHERGLSHLPTLWGGRRRSRRVGASALGLHLPTVGGGRRRSRRGGASALAYPPARSRIDTMPTTFPFSTTGRWRKPLSSIVCSASSVFTSGPTVLGPCVIQDVISCRAASCACE